MTVYLLEIAGYGLLLFVAALLWDKWRFNRKRAERPQLPLFVEDLLKKSELGRTETTSQIR